MIVFSTTLGQVANDDCNIDHAQRKCEHATVRTSSTDGAGLVLRPNGLCENHLQADNELSRLRRFGVATVWSERQVRSRPHPVHQDTSLHVDDGFQR